MSAREKGTGEKGLSRRSFIKASAGVATGATVLGVPAAVIGAPLAAAASETGAVLDPPSSPLPAEPVMAYVHDAQRGELTVLAGTQETTYRDPALVARLLAIAPRDHEGGADVIAP
jgi:hypothetical protein